MFEREERKRRVAMCWFISQMSVMPEAGLVLEPGTGNQSRYPVWMAGTQGLEQSAATAQLLPELVEDRGQKLEP